MQLRAINYRSMRDRAAVLSGFAEHRAPTGGRG